MLIKRTVVNFLIVGTIMFASLDRAFAQSPQPSPEEKLIVSQINCNDFTRQSDGSWYVVAGPGPVHLGGSLFGPGMYEAHHWYLNGVDMTDLLERTCGGSHH